MRNDKGSAVRGRTHRGHSVLSGPDVDEASSERVQIPQECIEVIEGKRIGPVTLVNAERERLDKKIHIRPPGAWLAATKIRDEIKVTRSGHRTNEVPIRQRQVKVILRALRLGESNIELVEIRRKAKLASAIFSARATTDDGAAAEGVWKRSHRCKARGKSGSTPRATSSGDRAMRTRPSSMRREA